MFGDGSLPSTHPPFIVQDLDLSRVAQFDHGSHGDIELPASFKVQPDIVPLDYNKKYISLVEYGSFMF